MSSSHAHEWPSHILTRQVPATVGKTEKEFLVDPSRHRRGGLNAMAGRRRSHLRVTYVSAMMLWERLKLQARTARYPFEGRPRLFPRAVLDRIYLPPQRWLYK